MPVKFGEERLNHIGEDTNALINPGHWPGLLAKSRSLAHAGWSVLFKASWESGRTPDSRIRSIASAAGQNKTENNDA
jgi:hypothetical protein